MTNGDNGDKTLLGVAFGAGIVILGVFAIYLILQNRHQQQMMAFNMYNDSNIREMQQRLDYIQNMQSELIKSHTRVPAMNMQAPKVHNVDDTIREKQTLLYYGAL